MSQSPNVALVTGGASGMGRIFALRLARQGARVAIFDLNDEGLQKTAAEADGITAYRCDVSNFGEVCATVDRVAGDLGPVDWLVHAAALMPSHALVNHAAGDVMRLLEINFGGTVYLVKALLPSMLERASGRMILFGSVAGYAMVPKMGAYCASKAAVNVYVETLRNELAGTGVDVHLVCPPAVNTPLVDQTMATETPGSIVEAKKAGRLADPEKIVAAIERGVAKNRAIIFPGEAKFLYLWHSLFPGFWWKTLMRFERG